MELEGLTRILKSAGGRASLVSAELLPLVYDELRNLAKARMSRMSPGQTLQATALVHEAWLKISGDEERSWSDRAHFFRAAAQAMRHILVDRARAKASLKRGENVEMLDIEVHGLEVEDTTLDERVLLVDEMMGRLEKEDPESVRVISLKFFGGLTNREIAAMDGVAERTVERHWAYAKARLYQMIRAETGTGASDAID
ncbi:MAG: sigma-70 family RNA polymerase sigma factor [Verrucomicrobiaceae bacterium]|nr:MAG: sigma-70 family RNA polymerase sigma factor [Verrucomicrobiaceae bacterium]